MQSTSSEVAGLDESQAGIKIARRGINNLCRWYRSNGKGEEELKSFLLRVKEESETALLEAQPEKN